MTDLTKNLTLYSVVAIACLAMLGAVLSQHLSY
jgi:hypothetical protein